MLGQRIHAVSRDLYDIFRLRERVNESGVLQAPPTKLAAREVEVEAGDIPRRLTDRKFEFEAHWELNLSGLLLIPTEVVRQFRGKPSTDSDARRPRVPRVSVRRFRRSSCGG
ncbi:MAG: hypothetical protein ACODAA_06485 [Gemmatimonadota bacterium]